MGLERRQWRLDTLQRNTRLASRIHDSASGGLSYIALTAQRQLRRIPDDDAHAGERADWRFVDEQALRVLDEIHHVIDLLERPEEPQGTAETGADSATAANADRVGSVGVIGSTSDDADETRATAPAHPSKPLYGRAIADAVDEARSRLDRLGFTGSMELRGAPDGNGGSDWPDGVGGTDASDEPVMEAARLIGEIASNITRHLDPAAGSYHAVVTLGEDAVEIMETNPLPVAPIPSRLAPHGSGLELHRRIITRLGGELNTSAEDGDWVIYARIPLHTDGATATGRAS